MAIKYRRAARYERWTVAAILAFGVLVLTGCFSKPHHFNRVDVSHGHEPALKLPGEPNASNQTVSARSLRGRWVILYFGYTHCPNICPTTLAKLNLALHKLKPEQAGNVRVIFVSVDPKRDTLKELVQYTHAFNPHFVALRPDPKTLPQFASHYHVHYSYGQRDAAGNYSVGHSSEFMIFGPDGHTRLMGTYQDSVEEIASDLQYLVQRQD